METDKSFQVESKRKKISSEAELDEAVSSLAEGHVGFNNSIFNSVGGDNFQRLAREGGTMIGAQGQGAFSGNASPAKGSFQDAQAAIEAHKAAAKAKPKEYDIGVARIGLLKSLSDDLEAIKKKIMKKIEESQKTVTEHESKLKPATGEDAAAEAQETIPFLAQYMEELRKRLSTLRSVHHPPGEQKPEQLTGTAKQLQEFIGIGKALLNARKGGAGEGGPQPLVPLDSDITSRLTPAVTNLISGWNGMEQDAYPLKSALTEGGWDGEKFKSPIDLTHLTWLCEMAQGYFDAMVHSAAVKGIDTQVVSISTLQARHHLQIIKLPARALANAINEQKTTLWHKGLRLKVY